MNSKLLGGILLVVGTTIGAGMLALPVATAELGFWASVMLLIGCWAIMTSCAFLFLEVNLWLPPNSNLISMAGATLGRWGQAIAWLFYLTLLYSIIAAYIAGGGDLFFYLFKTAGLPLPTEITSIIFTMLLGTIVYLGVKWVDYANRGLMFGKLGAFVILVALMLPSIALFNLDGGSIWHLKSPATVSITIVAFTGAMIIPTLRVYFEDNLIDLKKAIFYGTLIPLICYIAWDLVIMGVVPYEGEFGLGRMFGSSHSNSDLIDSINLILHKETINVIINFFESICMATSFLSIALCLSDFLSDGLSIAKKGVGKYFIFSLTFLPPIAIVLFYPDAFLKGLSLAGLSSFILMILFPPLMAWRGRYHHELATGSEYQVRGGKLLLVILLVFAILMVAFGIQGII